MKKKTGHRNTWQIRPFAYDTKYNAEDKSCFTEGHVLPCSCGHSTRFSVYGIPVHFVSRMYQGWWPGIATCRLWHRLLFGRVALCLFKTFLMHYLRNKFRDFVVS